MKAWIPTACLGFAAFVFVTSEFLPVGLLPVIAQHFGQTEAQTGLMMTIYAWVVGALSLPLTWYAASWDRRPLHLAIVGIFVFAQLLSACAGSFNFLLAARICAAAAHALFWAVAPPFAAQLAPPGKREHGIVVVAAGANLGGVLGIPLATFLGQTAGWRFAFAAIAVVAALAGLICYYFLPSRAGVVPEKRVRVGALFRRRSLVLVYVATLIAMTGHYGTFTFIAPYLERVGGLPSSLVPSILFAYGIAGLLAGFVVAPFLARRLRSATMVSVALLVLCFLFLRVTVTSSIGAAALLAAWAVPFMFLNLVQQKIVLDLAPDAEDVATAAYSGIYNIGIGGGALLGSWAAEAGQLPVLGLVSAGLMAVGGALLVGQLSGDR